jgi:hypothetical protein
VFTSFRLFSYQGTYGSFLDLSNVVELFSYALFRTVVILESRTIPPLRVRETEVEGAVGSQVWDMMGIKAQLKIA